MSAKTHYQLSPSVGTCMAYGARQCHVTDCTVKSLRKLIPANQLIARSKKTRNSQLIDTHN